MTHAECIEISKVRQTASQLTNIDRELKEKTSETSLHEAKHRELHDELETKSRRVGELEGILETKQIELKESASMVERMKALHGEQCRELEQQIEEVRRI